VQLLSGSTVVATLATYSNLKRRHRLRAQVVRHLVVRVDLQGQDLHREVHGHGRLVAGDLFVLDDVSLKTN